MVDNPADRPIVSESTLTIRFGETRDLTPPRYNLRIYLKALKGAVEVMLRSPLINPRLDLRCDLKRMRPRWGGLNGRL